MSPVMLLDQSHHFLYSLQCSRIGQANIKPIIVPLVADDPHQDRRVVLDCIDTLRYEVKRVLAPNVHGVQDVDFLLPKNIQNLRVIYHRICPDGINSCSRHNFSVCSSKASVVGVVRMGATLTHGVPTDTLQVQGFVINEELPFFNSRDHRCSARQDSKPEKNDADPAGHPPNSHSRGSPKFASIGTSARVGIRVLSQWMRRV
mmetsp:Transcript_113831/g.368372  ORF Transcript_113831/g.368372 Transcript_113831/m.368372 type:complete len:203 (-) Transcript_113831:46-654(-)